MHHILKGLIVAAVFTASTHASPLSVLSEADQQAIKAQQLMISGNIDGAYEGCYPTAYLDCYVQTQAETGPNARVFNSSHSDGYLLDECLFFQDDGIDSIRTAHHDATYTAALRQADHIPLWLRGLKLLPVQSGAEFKDFLAFCAKRQKNSRSGTQAPSPQETLPHVKLMDYNNFMVWDVRDSRTDTSLFYLTAMIKRSALTFVEIKRYGQEDTPAIQDTLHAAVEALIQNFMSPRRQPLLKGFQLDVLGGDTQMEKVAATLQCFLGFEGRPVAVGVWCRAHKYGSPATPKEIFGKRYYKIDSTRKDVDQ